MTTLRPTRLLPFLAIAALAIAACSGTTASGAPAASEAPAASTAPTASTAAGVCADAEAVRTSLAELRELDLVSVGKDGLTAAVTEAKAEIETLADSAKSSVGPEAQALTTALEDLEATVRGLSDDATLIEKATEIKAAVTVVQDAATNLRAALTECQ